MSITNPDKVVTKQDLANFYAELLPYLGGNNPVLGTINRSDIYDTTEKVVGKWIDGRPVYMKVLTGTLPTCSADGTAAQGTISIGSSVNELVFSYGYLTNTNNGVRLPMQVATNTNNAYGARYTVIPNSGTNNKNTVQVMNSLLGWSGLPCVFILKYTKTTDAANSYNYASENDYSTTEKIVGTWIDSKPIYQKTIPITLPTCTTDGTEGSASFAIGASIDTVVDVNAWFVYNAKVAPIFTTTSASTKYVRLLVQTNAYATAADRNILRISNASKSVSGCTGYATIQYTKTT